MTKSRTVTCGALGVLAATALHAGSVGGSGGVQLANPIDFLGQHACTINAASIEAAIQVGYDPEIIRQLGRDALAEGNAHTDENGAIVLLETMCTTDR